LRFGTDRRARRYSCVSRRASAFDGT